MTYSGAKGVWFSVQLPDPDAIYGVSLEHAFDGAAVFVYAGSSCGSVSLGCGLGSVTFSTAVYSTAYILVTGAESTDAGNFTLQIYTSEFCQR